MGHGHGHGHAAGRAQDRSRLRIVLAITLSVLVLEVVGAAVTGSLALIADAGHLATDAGAVVLALGASWMAARPAGPRSTFGYHRAEVLAAGINGLLLLVVCAYLAYAGVTRLADPEAVDGAVMAAFAAVGLVANGVSMTVLNRSETGSINLRGAASEVFADLIGSALALVAGLVMAATDFYRADPIASLVIAVLILPRAVALLRDAAGVLLELTPAGFDVDAVAAALREVDGVVDVHDLHAWTITSGIPSLSAHVAVDDDVLARTGPGPVLDRLCAVMADRFDVRHATFQVEPVGHRGHEDLGDLH